MRETPPTEREVIAFIGHHLQLTPEQLSPAASLFHDLGVAGADGAEFVGVFCAAFDVSAEGFDPVVYFGAEQAATVGSLLRGLFTKRPHQAIPRLTIADLVASARAGRICAAQRR